jgi:cobalt-precorrin 5A hydrolase / precorrin-3B C17-methyltransferase
MGVNTPCAVVALSTSGGLLARTICDQLGNAQVHGLVGRVEAPDVQFEKFADHLRALFDEGVAIVAVAASGVVIRALAASIRDKTTEPPVLAVSVDGAVVVPLLGGHRGANWLAVTIADSLGATAAVTTAGDVRFDVALDAPPAGYTLANPEHYKGFMARLLEGATVQIPADVPWLSDASLPVSAQGELQIQVTQQPVDGREGVLVYHPNTLHVGVGCERGTSSNELIELVRSTLTKHGLAQGAVAGVFSLDVKSDEVAVHALASELGVPARFFDASTLENEALRLANPSDVVFAEVGCHGVSEGAALAAAGPAAELIVPKHKSKRATCAVAVIEAPSETALGGTPRGELKVVGIGPGAREARTLEVTQALRGADHWVGYRFYLDLVEDLRGSQELHGYSLGEETDRVKVAIALAARGERVALVCSGDAGIYAMASLVYEVLDGAELPEWRRIAVEVLPGVSALQVAAARVGAPIGHDFCAISLSDLLTPREVITHRVEHAARGDFVIAFYNPVSRQRREPFEHALATLREHRAPTTPVIIARSLGRPDETVRVSTLGELHIDEIDMMTVLLVGARETRTVELAGQLSVYTPRGYARKFETPSAAVTETSE